jgi:hypothetical protein
MLRSRRLDVRFGSLATKPFSTVPIFVRCYSNSGQILPQRNDAKCHKRHLGGDPITKEAAN